MTAQRFACLAGVLKQVLPVRRAIFHFSDHADKLRMEAVDSEVDGRALSCLDDLLFHLLLTFATTSSMRAGWIRPSTTS